MTRTITGLFDSRAEAEAVVEHLRTHDRIDSNHVAIHGNTGQTTGTGTSDTGFWASLKDLFIADEDRQAYAEGIRRGGYVVSAQVDDSVVDHALDIFEAHGAVDLDSREAEWRASGWSGSMDDAAGTGTPMNTSGAVGAATMGGTATPAVGMGSTAAMGTGTTGAAMGAATTGTDREERIPVVEERLRVGKREMERGRVRVRSYIVETPVSENVTLHEEHVSIERRAVDQPLSAADDAFRERVIDAVEHSEEAVVAKEARVKEELVIRKDVADRTQTVSDTVRHTEVEVQDERTAAATGTTTGTTGTATGTTTGMTDKPRV